MATLCGGETFGRGGWAHLERVQLVGHLLDLLLVLLDLLVDALLELLEALLESGKALLQILRKHLAPLVCT